MRKLIEGMIEFRNNLRDDYRERFARLATTQTPDAIFFACSDSRVVPNLFASTDPGDLFVSRSVGNLVAPSSPDGMSTADEAEAAAIEFALLKLGVRDAVVCGHSNCGAMQALLEGVDSPELPNLTRWLRHGRPALQRWREGKSLEQDLPAADQISQLNVLAQMEHVRSYPAVRAAEASGRFAVHGLWFDIRKADVYAYEPELHRFVLLDRTEADRLIARL
ncbi:MAG: carbonic anhydrase [Deltaproteobacteria bacterium]